MKTAKHEENMKKNKNKTHKGASKRLFAKSNGRIKIYSQGRRHGLSRSSRKHNRLMKNTKYLSRHSMRMAKKNNTLHLVLD